LAGPTDVRRFLKGGCLARDLQGMNA